MFAGVVVLIIALAVLSPGRTQRADAPPDPTRAPVRSPFSPAFVTASPEPRPTAPPTAAPEATADPRPQLPRDTPAGFAPGRRDLLIAAGRRFITVTLAEREQLIALDDGTRVWIDR